MTETPLDASEEATEDTVIVNRPAAFADPINRHVYEFDATKTMGEGFFGFANFALSAILAPFHGAEYARNIYENQLGIHISDGTEKVHLARAQFNNSAPLDPDAPILELPENSGGKIVGAVYNEVDEIRNSVLASRAARTEFGGVAAAPEGEAPSSPLPQGPNFDPNDLGPY